MRKHPALIVLKSLLAGVPVTINGTDYNSTKDDDDHDRITFSADGETWWYPADITLDEFLQFAQQLDDDLLFLIGANIALNEDETKRALSGIR